MPTYEYECKMCGERFDVFQSIKAAPLRRARCASCAGSRPVRRLIGSGGAVLFKGSGFYQTDYRSAGYQKAAKADAGTSTTAATGEEKGSTGKGDAGKSDAVASPKRETGGRKSPRPVAADAAR